MIYQILYVSEKDKKFSDEMLDDIIEKSQQNNKKYGLTGILINSGNFFIQLLEGAKKDVEDRYTVIFADPRHRNVRTILTNEATERLFPNWSMGLVKDPPELNMQEILPYLYKEMMDEKEGRTKILKALRKFNRWEM